MKSLAFTLTVLFALAASTVSLAGGARGSGPESTACKSGQTTVGGSRAYRYCGSASAIVKIAGRTLRYRGGSCRRTPVALELNIGTAIVGADPTSLPSYFGLGVGRIFGVGQPATKDGTYTSSTIGFIDSGKRKASMQSQVALAGGRTHGSFSGKLFGGGSISGTFRCA